MGAVLAQQPELTERTSSVGTPLPPSDFELRTLSVDDLPQPALNTTVDDDDQDGLDEDYVAQVEKTLFAVPERMVRQASLNLGKQNRRRYILVQDCLPSSWVVTRNRPTFCLF